jgi:hypothetical protein
MVLRARVRLGGLWIVPGPAVPPELAGATIPWDRLGRSRQVCDAAGTPLRRGGQFVCLGLPTRLEQHAAARARFRWMRRLWNNGGLFLTDEARTPRCGWFILVATTSLGCLMIPMVRGAPAFVRDFKVLGAHSEFAVAVALAATVGLVLCALAVPLSGATNDLLALRPRRCTITAREIRVWLADGRELAYPWQTVRLTAGVETPILILDDRTRIALPPRIANVIHYRPPGLIPQRQPRLASRLSIYTALAVAVAAAITGTLYVAAPDGGRFYRVLTVPFVMALYPVLAYFLLLKLPRGAARWIRRRRKRRPA